MKDETRQLFDRIATWLEAGAPHEQARGMKFDMRNFMVVDQRPADENWCGTSCCIAGAAIAFAGSKDLLAGRIVFTKRFDEPGYNLDGTDGWGWGRKLLELTEAQSEYLFAPWNDYGPPEATNALWPQYAEDITPDWAARTIRRLIATGNVEWHLTKPEEVS